MSASEVDLEEKVYNVDSISSKGSIKSAHDLVYDKIESQRESDVESGAEGKGNGGNNDTKANENETEVLEKSSKEAEDNEKTDEEEYKPLLTLLEEVADDNDKKKKPNWEKIRHWFESRSPEEAKKELLEGKEPTYGGSALHRACSYRIKAPLDIIQKILQIGGVETAKLKNNEGELPLHYARYYKPHPKVIQALLEAYPEGAAEKDSNEGYPLHTACISQFDSEAIKALFDAYPDAAREKNRYGSYPIFYACECKCEWEAIQLLVDAFPECVREKDSTGDYPLHLACLGNCDSKVIDNLVQLYPECVREKGGVGNLPLHCAHIGICDLDVIQALLKEYPEAADVKNEEGKLPKNSKQLWQCVRQVDTEEPNWDPVHRWFKTHSPQEAEENLLEEKDTDDYYDDKDRTALHWACKNKAPLEIVKKMLELGGAPLAKKKSEHGRLALHEACMNNCELAVIEALIAKFPKSAQVENKDGNLALHCAYIGDCDSKVIQAVERAYPDGAKQENNKGRVPKDAKALLKCMRDVDYYNSKWDAVNEWIDSHKPEEIKKSLLKDVDDDGWSALHYACAKKVPLETIKKFLSKENGGAEAAKMKDENGYLPIHIACRSDCDLPVFEALKEAYPIGIRTKTKNGRTPLHAACYYAVSPELVQALLAASEDSAHEKDEDGELPIHLACTNSFLKVQVIEALIGVYPDSVLEKNKKERLPLHKACLYGCNLEVIQTLIDSDKSHESVRVKDSDGNLPLHIAYQGSEVSEEKLHALVEAYPKGVEEKNNNGMLPKHYTDKFKPLWKVFEEIGDSEEKEIGEKRWLPAKEWLEKRKGNKEAKNTLRDDKDGEGLTALHWACKVKAPHDIIKEVLKVCEEFIGKMKDKKGRLPLHFACEQKCPLDVVKAFLRKHEEAIFEKDTDGRLPLHVACEHNCDLETIKLLIDKDKVEDEKDEKDDKVEDEKDGRKAKKSKNVRVKDNDNRFPLHSACQGKCNPVIMKVLIDEYPEAMEKKDKNSKTPFALSEKAASDYVKLLLDETESNDGDSVDVGELLARCKEYMPRGTFLNATLSNIDSPKLTSWLNEMTSQRKSVSFIMRDFYVYVALMVSFFFATKQYIACPEPKLGWAISLIPLALLLLSFESQQLLQLKQQGETFTYFLDPWNWAELSTIFLSLASAIKLLVEESAELNVDDEPMRHLLMATGFFLFISFISFLKKTFYTFSMFVGASVNIFQVLIPFLVITAMTLVIFAYMYYVKNFGSEGHTTFEESFLTTFAMFVGGPDETVSLLDILFGIVTVIVLLNVVIAIVSNAWDAATEQKYARTVFWNYHVNHILETTKTDWDENATTKKPDESDAKDSKNSKESDGKESSKPIPIKDKFGVGYLCGLQPTLDGWTLNKYKRYVYGDETVNRFYNSNLETYDGNLRVLLKFGIFVGLCLLGLFTFGMFWPMCVREYLFQEKLEEEDDDESQQAISELHKKNKELVSKVDEIKTENEKLVSKVDEMKNDIKLEMDELKSQNQLMLTLLEGLSKKEQS